MTLTTRQSIETYFTKEKSSYIDEWHWVGINVGYDEIEVEIDGVLPSIEVIKLAQLLKKCDSALSAILS
jgi:hypothetical protein